MENEKRTDRNSWAELDENRLSDILTASQIKATDTYETPPQIIWIDNSTIATLGNFSASTGKAKAKKTFNVSAIVAASLAGRQVLNYRAHLPEGKRRILYVDTEQSRFHCHNVLERILRLAGLPTTTDNENLDFICLREYTPAVRIGVIEQAIYHSPDIGLVIIDGIRDMVYDINSPGESTRIISKLMQWTDDRQIHIHTILHQNKGDENARGHIGTELNNKAETVLQITKSQQDGNISEVKAMHIRDREFDPFAFRINDNALPEVMDGYVFQQPKQDRNFPLTELTEQQHREALENGFGKQVVQGYSNVIAALKQGYASIGYERGRNVLVSLNKFLVNKRMIVKEGKGYRYNPDFHY